MKIEFRNDKETFYVVEATNLNSKEYRNDKLIFDYDGNTTYYLKFQESKEDVLFTDEIEKAEFYDDLNETEDVCGKLREEFLEDDTVLTIIEVTVDFKSDLKEKKKIKLKEKKEKDA